MDHKCYNTAFYTDLMQILKMNSGNIIHILKLARVHIFFLHLFPCDMLNVFPNNIDIKLHTKNCMKMLIKISTERKQKQTCGECTAKEKNRSV